MQVEVNRKDVRFVPDQGRVIARFNPYGDDQNKRIIRKVLNMSPVEVDAAVSQVLRGYTKRHRNISRTFENHFNHMRVILGLLNVDPDLLTLNQRLLIGSYFTMEYSIESAAFFNPSIVEHPDQSELQPGEKRVILSFRATGEGHISSIVFSSGVLDKNNNFSYEPRGNMLEEAQSIKQHVYDKLAFRNKLEEMKFYDKTLSPSVILDQLSDQFTYSDLKKCVEETKRNYHFSEIKTLTLEQIMWLASSHYEIEFSMDTALSERVIFPITETEKNGIEDARFVRFTDDDGHIKYFATYTAYDGSVVMPKLIETESFYNFNISPLHGEIVMNKGMAIFPRKVNGKYAMLGRIDGASNYISFSDDIRVWREAKLLQEPKYPWEFIKIGNCGSPIETDEGWLVITHAVGQMREYVLGASLFDLDDPTREIGRLKTPLMIPNAEEREGYVPNVVYSCGSMVNNNEVIIPYAMSDYISTYACVNLSDLLTTLKNSK